VIRQVALIGLAAVSLFTVGCASDASRPPPPAEAAATPWQEAGAPDILATLAVDLTTYRATAGRLPDTLAMLDATTRASHYAQHAFAYHPAGLGLLGAGWSVFVVDDQLREADAVWCVVRQARNPLADLRAVKVPLVELRAAAIKAAGTR
jgi:hypothetical protein